MNIRALQLTTTSDTRTKAEKLGIRMDNEDMVVYGNRGLYVTYKLSNVTVVQCRSNLRVVSRCNNSQNQRSRSGTSQYKGVCWDKNYNMWQATINFNGNKKKHIGRFDNEIDAALAYDQIARKIHGEFGRYNFPADNEQQA